VDHLAHAARQAAAAKAKRPREQVAPPGGPAVPETPAPEPKRKRRRQVSDAVAAAAAKPRAGPGRPLGSTAAQKGLAGAFAEAAGGGAPPTPSQPKPNQQKLERLAHNEKNHNADLEWLSDQCKTMVSRAAAMLLRVVLSWRDCSCSCSYVLTCLRDNFVLFFLPLATAPFQKK